MVDSSKRVAFITGPTSGIGEAFAHQLAFQGYNLVLVARHKGKLDRLASALQKKYNIEIKRVLADLSVEKDVQLVEQVILEMNRLDLMINNAGFGVGGYFVEVPFQKQMDMINVHLGCTIRFCRAAIPVMANQSEKGHIINVSSLVAFIDLPGSVMYTTTKSAIVRFSKTLQFEVKDYQIKIQALCPVFTPTAFHETMGTNPEYLKNIPSCLWTSKEDVVLSSLKALNSRRVICVPGYLSKLLYWGNRQPVLGPIIHRIAMMLSQKSEMPPADELKINIRGQKGSHLDIQLTQNSDDVEASKKGRRISV